MSDHVPLIRDRFQLHHLLRFPLCRAYVKTRYTAFLSVLYSTPRDTIIYTLRFAMPGNERK